MDQVITRENDKSMTTFVGVIIVWGAKLVCLLLILSDFRVHSEEFQKKAHDVSDWLRNTQD